MILITHRYLWKIWAGINSIKSWFGTVLKEIARSAGIDRSRHQPHTTNLKDNGTGQAFCCYRASKNNIAMVFNVEFSILWQLIVVYRIESCNRSELFVDGEVTYSLVWISVAVSLKYWLIDHVTKQMEQRAGKLYKLLIWCSFWGRWIAVSVLVPVVGAELSGWLTDVDERLWLNWNTKRAN